MLRRVPARKELLQIEGREVPISNPEKVFFPQRGYTKLDLVRYYLAVSDGALRGAGGAAHGAQALSQRRRAGVLLPETRAARAGLDRDGGAEVPLGADRARGGGPR